MCTKSLNCNPSEQLKFLFLIAFLIVIGITLFTSCPGPYTKYNLKIVAGNLNFLCKFNKCFVVNNLAFPYVENVFCVLIFFSICGDLIFPYSMLEPI